ncbi:voltage-gated sodium channel [Desulfitispora alkaliphila]|uniref:ion transporter n=1 Tax=Desulfitispora alkaliphila TaxID=622674 RepID=UPI003D1ADD3C
MHKVKNLIAQVVHSSTFSTAIITLIILNAVVIGLETYPSLYVPHSHWFFFLDQVFLWIFTLEIIMRLIVANPTKSYFRDGWNLFDFFIVASGHLLAGAHFVTVLRILRILRILRTISTIPSLRRLVNALIMTIPSMGNIMLLLSLFFYIFGVIGTIFFAQAMPEYFGSLHATLLTLFQVVTLESWASGVMRPLVAEVPWAWTYFVAFILMGTFVIFNLFIGVIVSNVEKCEDDEDETDTKDTEQQLTALRAEVAELKELLLKLNKEK